METGIRNYGNEYKILLGELDPSDMLLSDHYAQMSQAKK